MFFIVHSSNIYVVWYMVEESIDRDCPSQISVLSWGLCIFRRSVNWINEFTKRLCRPLLDPSRRYAFISAELNMRLGRFSITKKEKEEGWRRCDGSHERDRKRAVHFKCRRLDLDTAFIDFDWSFPAEAMRVRRKRRGLGCENKYRSLISQCSLSFSDRRDSIAKWEIEKRFPWSVMSRPDGK